MKKILIASTALVAAGLMTSAAQAADPIKLSVGGFSKWWVVGQWNENVANAGGAGTQANYNNVDVKGDNEIHFKGSTTLDNGLKVGVVVEFEGGGHTDKTSDVIDESYAFIEGGFGKVLVGSANNGTYLLHVKAPDAAGNWGDAGIMTGDAAIVRPNAVTGLAANSAAGVPSAINNTTAINTDNDAEKITYVAPSFGGLTLGASYVPNATEDDRSTGVAQQIYGVGALYANTFGGVGVKVSGGWVTYDIAATTSRSQEWSTGAQVSYAGFTVGGSYRKVDTNYTTDKDGTNRAANTLVGANSSKGYGWDAGVQYASGPYAVSLAYFKSSVEGLVGVAGEDEVEFYQASAKYTMGPGVDVLASIGHAKYDDERAEAASGDMNHNEGWVVMTGLSLAF